MGGCTDMRNRFTIAVVLLNIAWLASATAADATEKVSRFGEYSGYTEAKFDSYVLESVYVPMRDGVRVAVDIYHPAVNGVAVKEKTPTLLTVTYAVRAAILPDGTRYSPWSPEPKQRGNLRGHLLKHGYTIVVADIRGQGASFGEMVGFWSDMDLRDKFDLIEWLADQPWSDGNIGMIGGSGLGNLQISAAAVDPPSLKAIMPAVFNHNFLDDLAMGGVPLLLPDSITGGSSLLDYVAATVLKGEMPANNPIAQWIGYAGGRVAPVDGPEGEQLLSEAIKDHATKRGLLDVAEDISSDVDVATLEYFRPKPATPLEIFQGKDGLSVRPPTNLLPHLNASRIPIYLVAGWLDVNGAAPMIWFRNIEGPKKLLMGSWEHSITETVRNNSTSKEMTPIELRSIEFLEIQHIETLRWFDYWLKGINNGIMDEPPLHYTVNGKNTGERAWLSSEAWPPKYVTRKDFFLGSADETAGLSEKRATSPNQSEFVVDYTATLGLDIRHKFHTVSYPEMSEFNSKGLVFTSDVLQSPVMIAGSPIVTLNVTSTAADGEFHAVLQKVHPDGTSQFITEGAMKASWRVQRNPGYDIYDLPWPDGRQEVVEATPALNESGVTRLEFRLQPTGYRFEEGTRIRLAIAGANKDSTQQIELDPPPTVTIFGGGNHDSKISLPILPPNRNIKIETYRAEGLW